MQALFTKRRINIARPVSASSPRRAAAAPRRLARPPHGPAGPELGGRLGRLPQSRWPAPHASQEPRPHSPPTHNMRYCAPPRTLPRACIAPHPAGPCQPLHPDGRSPSPAPPPRVRARPTLVPLAGVHQPRPRSGPGRQWRVVAGGARGGGTGDVSASAGGPRARCAATPWLPRLACAALDSAAPAPPLHLACPFRRDKPASPEPRP